MLDVQVLTYPATTVCLQGETRKGGRRKENRKEAGERIQMQTLKCSAENQPEQTSEIIVRDWIKVWSKKAVVVFKECGGYNE